MVDVEFFGVLSAAVALLCCAIAVIATPRM
jgi:hypothetical protein